MYFGCSSAYLCQIDVHYFLKIHLWHKNPHSHTYSHDISARYRLLPQITLTQPVYDEEAERLMNCCGDGVFRLVDEGNRKRAIVGNTRDCLHSRECLDPERGVPGKVKLQMVKDHFIFRIEAIGQIPAEELFERALGELATKCRTAVDMLRGVGG